MARTVTITDGAPAARRMPKAVWDGMRSLRRDGRGAVVEPMLPAGIYPIRIVTSGNQR
jgi:hypothetical protein